MPCGYRTFGPLGLHIKEMYDGPYTCVLSRRHLRCFCGIIIAQRHCHGWVSTEYMPVLCAFVDTRNYGLPGG